MKLYKDNSNVKIYITNMQCKYFMRTSRHMATSMSVSYTHLDVYKRQA